MEKAVHITTLRNLKYYQKGKYQRIYWGVEFCQNLIPTLNNLKTIFSLIKKKKKRFTLLTPYVTGYGLERLEPLFQFLESQNDNIEVVVNDWGILKLIRENYKNLEPVLGRLLTKQKRDPRAQDILLNRQESRRVIGSKTKKTYIVIPKKVPSSLYEHFKASVFNVPIFQKFLLDNGIRRVEIDNLVWDMKIEVPEEISVSIYLPYAYVTTTRLCGLVNLSYSACRKECQSYYFSFKSNSSSLPFYTRGNTVFYESGIPKEKYLKERHIDRIVWEPEVPG